MLKNEPITANSLREEVENWVNQDKENPGAWDMFTVHTLKKLQQNYDETMKYLSQITKSQFDFICEAIDEVVYHFQRIEMVELIENLYHKFYGNDTDTDFYRDNIKVLRDCIKNKS